MAVLIFSAAFMIYTHQMPQEIILEVAYLLVVLQFFAVARPELHPSADTS